MVRLPSVITLISLFGILKLQMYDNTEMQNNEMVNSSRNVIIEFIETKQCKYTFKHIDRRDLLRVIHEYVDLLFNSNIDTRKAIHSLADYFTEIYQNVKLQFSCGSGSYSKVTTYLCGSMYFQSWAPSSKL